jgi:hypothetical protein
LTRAERSIAASVKLCQKSAEAVELSRNSMRLAIEAISASRAIPLGGSAAVGQQLYPGGLPGDK